MSNEAPLGHQMYDFSKPERVGPGVWTMWMLMSVHSEDKLSRLWVCKQIRLFVDYFKCNDCKPHAVLYLVENPPEDHIETADLLFEWVVTFMNNVNKRIGKLTYNKDILHKQFTDPTFMVCTAGCGHSDNNVSNNNTNNTNNTNNSVGVNNVDIEGDNITNVITVNSDTKERMNINNTRSSNNNVPYRGKFRIRTSNMSTMRR